MCGGGGGWGGVGVGGGGGGSRGELEQDRVVDTQLLFSFYHMCLWLVSIVNSHNAEIWNHVDIFFVLT